ncbi:hypothetical protein NP493_1553g00020 [Ridgeia piscesae]|uniref:ABC-2 type transporter transmembrane domain-containing protein n=1 Tax=Ridgeia piscesae TaxID=27915 RepID=A0AAD9K0N2_RIDPI|nr:hypothetical protein NP493_1553g00020 [Ridgeia piscesae]
MGKLWRQFKALTWKNYRVYRKKPFTFCGIVIGPTIVSLLTVFLNRKRIVTATSELWVPESPDLCLNHRSTYCSMDGKQLHVYYAPNVNVTRCIMARIKETHKHKIDITGFANESVMIDKLHAMCGDYLCGIIGGVVFSNLPRDGDTLPTHVRYKIRMRSEGSVSARYSVLPYLKYPSCRRREKGDYFDSGFLFLQHRIDLGIIAALAPAVNITRLHVDMQRFPHPAYDTIEDEESYDPEGAVVRIFLVTFAMCTCLVAKDVTYDKLSRMQVFLNLAGVSTWLQWAVWFVNYYFAYLVTAAIVTAAMKINMSNNMPDGTQQHYYSIVGDMDASLLFLLISLYLLALIAFSFLVSVFFTRATTATCVTVMIVFALVTPARILMDNIPQPFTALIVVCLCFPSCLLYALHIIDEFRTTGIPLGWNNVNHYVTVVEEFTLLYLLLLLLFDAIMYMTIALYLNSVLPGKYGLRKPWYFPLMVSNVRQSMSMIDVLNEIS